MGTASDQYPALLSSSATVAGHGDDGGSSTRRREGAAAGGGGHGASAELERILADESVPSAARLARAAPVELRLLVALAAPAVAVYMINYAMSMSTRIICGQLGTLELAAASLGNVGIQVFAYGLMADVGRVLVQGVLRLARVPPAVGRVGGDALPRDVVTVLIAGLLKDPEIALDSLAVCVRVSNELGAGNPRAAAFSVKVVTSLSLIVAAIIAAIVMCLREYLSYVFTQGEEVARAVSTMTPLLAVTIVLNGIQPGIYGGMIVGLFVQTLILVYVTFRTDWNREVGEAKKRLNKWGDIAKPLLANED
uniref:Protein DETOXIFICATION n=1 Tax=Oryza meridionalis TaxID=40149 RepID=A0A0E0D2Y4_9ORYZ